MSSSRRLDDLDRLALRLARVLQATYPHLLTKAFPLGELERRLVPLQEVRRELSRDGADCYDLAMLRLLTGERNYLVTPEEVQQAARRALAMSAPSAGPLKPMAATAVQVGDGLGQLLETLGSPLDYGSMAVPAQRTPALALVGRDDAGSARGKKATACCRYCSGTLPSGRRVTFCPHCGLDLTVRHCPACSTTLDLDWRFCVSCGRGVDAPSPGVQPTDAVA
ncbi:MAG: zinc ribbon domain-containing protein [Gemmatimonadaceae bacterium]|nr:zinc ribbon domain-containing protein [Gemmatimonadaceae bacterium]